jgi:hypothetical protein
MLKIEDLPKDAVVRIDPDFEAPGIEWVKRDGPKIKPFETSEVITGTGLTTLSDVAPDTPFEFVDSDLTLYHNVPTQMVTFEPNNNFVITGDNGEELVCIDMGTGKTTIGPEYAPDEAARVFWNCIEQHKQPDAWEENANNTSTELLHELRNIIGCEDGEDILAVARQVVGDSAHKLHCNWHKWDHSCSWSGSDCTCDKLMSAPPGIADDMPDDVAYFQEKMIVGLTGKKTWKVASKEEVAFDDAMKVID